MEHKTEPLTYFITGGSGFLGINLIRFLLDKGHKIKSFDLVDFDYPEKEQTKNETLCDIRYIFEKFNLISGLHSFMSDGDKIYQNVLPPISLLSEKDKQQLIEELNKINFTLESLKAA